MEDLRDVFERARSFIRDGEHALNQSGVDLESI